MLSLSLEYAKETGLLSLECSLFSRAIVLPPLNWCNKFEHENSPLVCVSYSQKISNTIIARKLWAKGDSSFDMNYEEHNVSDIHVLTLEM